MNTLAGRLYEALKAAGLAITGVSVGDKTDKSTWRVRPESLQSAAQPIIDAFTIAEPSPAKSASIPAGYLGIMDADPKAPQNGDLWIVREMFPTQTRTMKFRDGDVTRTLQTLVL